MRWVGSKGRKDRGAALIVAMVAIIATAGMAVALINMASTRSKGASDRTDRFEAFQAAQAAVDRAMVRMAVAGPENASFGVQFLSDSRVGKLNDIATTDGGDDTGGPTGDIDLKALDTTAMINDAEYFARVGDAGNSTYAIVGAARLGGAERVIEVIVKPPASDELPGPFPPSGEESGGAISLFGQVGKKAKLKLPGHLGDPADSEDGDDLVVISGKDKAGNQDTLGLGVSDIESYKKLVEDITKKMAEGKIPEGVFDGDPLNTFDVKGTDVTTSIGESKGLVDGDTMEAYAEAVAETVRNELIPQAIKDGTYYDDDTFKKDKGEILTDATWGDSPDDVTVIDAKKLKIDGDATIEGTGTLVIMGELDIHHADFEWDGDIILLGDTKDAKLHNHHATLDVDGTIVALGSGKKGKSKIHIHNDKKTDDSTSSINGGVLLLGGGEDTKDKVEFKVKHGSLDMRGLLMMMGHQVKVDIKPEHGKKKGDPGHFNFDGNLVLGTSEYSDSKKEKKNKLDVKLSGNVAIQHDSDAVNEALGLFKEFFDEFAPDVEPPATTGSYDIVLWREK